MVRPLPLDNPPNPWLSSHVEYCGEPPLEPLTIHEDQSRSILAENDSPDLGFRWSLNPYRGCFHGCAYCYARPSHEQLGYGAGSDFERRIVIKPRAAELLREAFERRSWRGELILFSGNTDCYQPLEASCRLTRACLEVCAEYRNPVHIITKAPLIERDLDLLELLHQRARLGVTLSIPFWDEATARAIEPGVAAPRRRLDTVRRLAARGLRVGVNVAPIIAGLNDRDIPAILEAAAHAGATSAAFILLRLPGNVLHVFAERLERALPLAAERVLARTRELRGGRLNDPRFGSRMHGEGQYAAAIETLFEKTRTRLGLARGSVGSGDEGTSFARPTDAGGQLRLFDPTGR